MSRPWSTDACTTRPPPAQDGWAYFLDVDGTLIPHFDTQEEACATPQLQQLLLDLTHAGPVALVSGRDLPHLQDLCVSRALCLVGQNGLEGHTADGHRWRQRSFSTELRQRMQAQLLSLQSLNPLMGIEDKGLMWTLHCRLIPKNYKETSLPTQLRNAVRQSLSSVSEFVVLGWGKTGVDLMPCRFGKAQAVSWLMCHPSFRGRRAVFIGDDWADEAAFVEVQQRHGLSIKVGDGPTAAKYRLDTVSEVHQWLHERS